jgi:glycolate oxidase iron-sulfur subunit
MLSLLTRPAWLRFGTSLARATGARHWLAPLARRVLPRGSALRAAISLLPALPASRRSRSRVSAPECRRGKVGIFGGCVQGALERDVQNATARLLAAAGFEVTRIEGLCCGALAAHTGDSADAAAKARRVREAFEAGGMEMLLTATPGCLGTLREELAGTQVHDAMAFLDLHGDALEFHPLDRKAVLHLPCTQVNVARADAAVRRLLARVPGLELDVLPTRGLCCGAAGSYMLEFPARAVAQRQRVFENLPDPLPGLLLTSNIGCRLHLGAGLHERGTPMEVQHPLMLLAQQLRT